MFRNFQNRYEKNRLPLARARSKAELNQLESRLLLSVLEFSADAQGVFDADGDGAFSSTEIYISLLTDNQRADRFDTFYFEVYESDGGIGDELLMRSGIQTTGDDEFWLNVPLDSSVYTNLPGDDTDGTLEVAVKLFDLNGVLLAQTQSDTITMESYWNDGRAGGVDNPEISLQVLEGTTVAPNGLYTLRGTATGITEPPSGMVYWIERQNNGEFDPIVEAPFFFVMKRIAVSNLTSSFEATLKWPSELNHSNAPYGYRIGARTYDDLGFSFSFASPQPYVQYSEQANASPVLTAVKALGDTVAFGQPVSFLAAAFDDTAVSSVTFFIDRDVNGQFAEEVDAIVGVDSSSDGGWSYNGPALNSWGTIGSTIRIGAIARDQQGMQSIPRFDTVRLNERPVITAIWGNDFDRRMGESFDFYISGQDNDRLTGATPFIDKNNDGVFTSGIDLIPNYQMTIILGEPNQFKISVRAEAAWGSGTIHIRGWVSDSDNARSSVSAESFSFNLDPRPVVESVISSAPAIVNIGQAITLTATVIPGDQPITAVTFYLDKDSNQRFSPGDVDLGADFDIANEWSITSVLPWSYDVGEYAVVSAARDATDRWSVRNASLLINVSVNRPPVVNAIVASTAIANPASVVNWGQPLTLTAQVSEPVQVVTFFFDMDSNGRFTAGDLDLGADFDGSNGWSITKVIPAWYGSGTARFVASARDQHGMWSTETKTTIVRLNAPPVITSITASPGNTVSWGQTLTLTATVSDDANQVRAVTFFFDLDGNARFTPGDEDLGADFNGSNGWSITKVIPSSYGSGNARFVASAVDQNDAWATITKTATLRLNAPPSVSSLTSTLTSINWGDTFTLSANVIDDANAIRAVTFFFDLDSNGRFSAGDVDMGADFDGSNGWSITRALPQWYGNGPAKFVASAVDTDNAWSTVTRTVNVTLIARPLIQGPPTFTTNPVPRNSTTMLSVTSPNPTYVGAVTAFLDVNGDGVWTSGTDRDLGVLSRVGNSSTWSLTINITSGNGFANPGSYTIRIDSRDIYGNWLYAKLTATLNVA